LALVILAVFVFGVFPTGRYIDHRNDLDRARDELAELREENARLQARVDRLESDAEIERVARAEYDMVLPGEEVYAVLPPAGD
jgi:cell division protein FtsB